MKTSKLIGILAIVVIVPIVIFTLWTGISQILYMLDPCVTWGAGSTGVVTLNPAAGGPCSTSAGATSETIPEAIFFLILVQGGILSAAVLGALGIIKVHSRLVVAASIVLLAESALLATDGLFIFTALAAGFFLWARSNQRQSGDDVARLHLVK